MVSDKHQPNQKKF